MKKTILYISCMSLLTLASSLSFGSTMGRFNVEGPVVTDIEHKGLATISRATVGGVVDITGKLNSNDTIFNKALTCTGFASLNNVTLNFNSEFRGKLNMKKSQINGKFSIRGDEGSVIEDSIFTKTLNFTGNDIVISGKTLINKMEVNQSVENPRNPIIHLNAGVNVTEEIRFNGWPGKVLLSDGVTFSGKIINGELVK